MGLRDGVGEEGWGWEMRNEGWGWGMRDGVGG